MSSKIILIAAATLLIGIGTAKALEVKSSTRPPDILITAMADYRESYIAAALSPLRRSGADHINLTRDDVNRSEERNRAARKAMLMTAFFTADVNGDNVLDASELANQQINYELKRQNIAAADTDHDGKVSLQEALVFASNSSALVPDGFQPGQLDRLLALDPNGDGKLTATELQTMAAAAFDFYDKDGDGVLSGSEKAAMISDRYAANQADALRQQMASCPFPKIDANASLYIVGSYEGGTLSNVSVGGPDDTTETATIDIDAGDSPVVVMATSYRSVIWRVTGHVERVGAFFASARAGVGVIGVPKEKLSVSRDTGCLQRFDRADASARLYYAGLASVLDHKIDGIVLRYTAMRIALPADAKSLAEDWTSRFNGIPDFALSGLPSRVGAEAFPEAIASLKRFTPGGVEAIDPTQVVGSGEVKPYTIMPQEAGLLQLLQDGSLEKRGGSFFVKKPFARYPSDLAGAHAVSFTFPEGMKLPDGNRGHSRVTIVGPDGAVKP
jgi:Ca2+-binding EF-hand superfamily protein